MNKIDTHQHFWQLSRGDYRWLTPKLTSIYRDFSPTELYAHLQDSGVTATIAVQAADTEAETKYLLDLAEQHDWIIGVVGWVNFEAPDAPNRIESLAQHPKLVSMRPMIQDIVDDAWMLGRAQELAINALIKHKLTFDALVLPQHLENLNILINRHPDLTVVVNHGAKPIIREKVFEPWATDLASIAARPNVFCKLSGLVTEAKSDWTRDSLQGYVDHIFKSFGKDRILFGSDWPVLNLASTYSVWANLADSLLESEFGDNKQAVYYKNVLSAYPRLQNRE